MNDNNLQKEIEKFEKKFNWALKDSHTTTISPVGWYVKSEGTIHTVTLIFYYNLKKCFAGAFKYRTINGKNAIEHAQIF